MNLRQKYRFYREVYDRNKTKPLRVCDNISYANWWNDDARNIWFTRFINANCKDLHNDIRFYSVFGPAGILDEKFNGIKIFFTGENLENPFQYKCLQKYADVVEDKVGRTRIKDYGDYGIGKVDISLGFVEKDIKSYLRFPFWILWLFSPDCSYNDIKIRISELNNKEISCERKGAAIISSHDFSGSRSYICDDLQNIVDIEYSGKWHNNSSKLVTEFNNNKIDYLKTKRFNICPENVDAYGYVTEKLFDSFASGAIPIYHGNCNHPEPGLINDNAIIFWNYDDDNAENRKLINRLNTDEPFYLKFMRQDKFNDDAAEIIWNYFVSLKNIITETDLRL